MLHRLLRGQENDVRAQWTRTAVFAAVVALAACDSGDEPSVEPSPPADSGPRTTTEACVGERHCPGERMCTAGTCGDCSCSDIAGPAWTIPLPVSPKELAIGPDGRLFLLLNDSPWLQVVDDTGSSATLSDILPRTNVGWAKDILVSSDGSIYLGGPGRFADEWELQVQRLDIEGEIVDSFRLDTIAFGGFDQAANGDVLAGIYFEDEFMAARVLSDRVERVSGVPIRAFGVSSLYSTALSQFAILGGGKFAIALGGDDSPFIGVFGTDGSAVGLDMRFATYNVGSCSRMAPQDSSLPTGGVGRASPGSGTSIYNSDGWMPV